MYRSTGIALGLSALVIGVLASRSGASSAPPDVPRRPPVPSTARRAFASRADVPIRSGPAETTPSIGTLGLGSGVLVGPEELPGWLPIVREWVDEGGARFARVLGFLAQADVTFTDPRAPAMGPGVGAESGPRSDGGECDELFHFAGWPSQVDDFKARMNTLFDDTDATVRACGGLSGAERQRWAGFLATWKTFSAKKTDTFGSYGDWKSTCTYSKQLDGWRNEVLAKARCEAVGPTNIHGYDLPGGVQTGVESLATIVKWGALGVGGAVLLATFYPEIKALTAPVRARATKSA